MDWVAEIHDFLHNFQVLLQQRELHKEALAALCDMLQRVSFLNLCLSVK